MFEGPEDETEEATGNTFQLPGDNPKEVLGQREKKYKAVSTIVESSGYGTAALSECESAENIRPNF